MASSVFLAAYVVAAVATIVIVVIGIWKLSK